MDFGIVIPAKLPESDSCLGRIVLWLLMLGSLALLLAFAATYPLAAAITVLVLVALYRSVRWYVRRRFRLRREAKERERELRRSQRTERRRDLQDRFRPARLVDRYRPDRDNS